MDDKLKNLWETTYKGENQSDKPHELVSKTAPSFPSGCRILDIGCGSGRNAIYLANLGFNVTALDFADSGIKRMKEKAEKMGLKIESVVGDMENSAELSRLGSFDVMLSINSLHFLYPASVNDVIEWMKSNTINKGYNIISAFGEKETVRDHEVVRYLFGRNELRKKYSDWSVQHYKEFLGNENNEDIRPCVHYFVHFVAKKSPK